MLPSDGGFSCLILVTWFVLGVIDVPGLLYNVLDIAFMKNKTIILCV